MALGVKRGTVQVVPYQANWKLLYEQEKCLLSAIFAHLALDIQHVGSTSIEGLSAKPIIDIAILVQVLPISSEIRSQLVNYQYHERVNRLGPGQVVYVKGPEQIETHILHIIPLTNADWTNKLRFRDYLRTHPEALQAYEVLKGELGQQYANDRGAYTQGKNEFIDRILSIAP